MSSDDSKSQARKRALFARRSLRAGDREIASALICDRIVRSHEFMACSAIACYLATADEVDPGYIIMRAWRAKKRVFVPVIDTHGAMGFCEIGPDSVVIRNRMGIWEPVSGTMIDAKSLDVVITPLVAFDDAGNRIGMGGGYYDRCFRFLRNRRKWLNPKLIGVAFECQKTKKIASDHWDVSLYKIVTDAK